MIRRAAATDAVLLAAMHGTAFPPGEAWSDDAFALQLAFSNVTGLIHRDGGMILLRVAADEAEILTFAVIPEARRRGIGGALLQKALETAMDAGARVITLEVAVNNEAAASLYQRAGFRQIAERPRYYRSGAAARILQRTLAFGSPDQPATPFTQTAYARSRKLRLSR